MKGVVRMFQIIRDVLGIKSNNIKNKNEVKFELPIKDIKDLIVGSDGRYKLVTRVSPVNGALLSENDLSEIAEAIQGALNSFDGRMQILLQSEKVDIKNNLENIEKRKQELNSEIKIAILEQSKKHLAAMANKSRNILNFYMVLESNEKTYDEAEQLLQDNFTSIKNELESQEMYVERLKKDDIKETLYRRLNPESSQLEPYNKDWSIENLMPENATLFQDGRHIQIENRIYRFFSITDFPLTVDNYRWLHKLTTIKGDINISFILTPKNKATIRKQLSNAARELGGKKNINENNEALRQEYEAEEQSAKEMISDLGSDNINLYDTNITIGISAENIKELNTLTNILRSKISATYCQGTELKRKDFEPFYNTLPILPENEITKDYVWNLSSKDIGSLVLFDSSEFMETKGTLIGENETSRGLVIANYYNKIYNNGHMCVIADSGSGKTFFLMTDAIRNIPYVDYTIMFDLKGDLIFPFGKRYSFTASSGIITNPFHIRNTVVDETDKNSTNTIGTFLAEKIMNLIVFFRWIIRDMTPLDEGLLEEDIRDCYKKDPYNLTFESKELPKVFPTMETLKEVQEEKIEKADSSMEKERRIYIKACLKPYTTGAYSKMFNGQTNWDFDFFTVFDLSDINEAVQKPLYDILLKDVWQFAKKDGTKNPTLKRIYVDECHIFADPKNPQTLEFISTKLSKMVRGFGGFLITATQNLPDFLSIPRYGQAIIDNSYFKIFFRLGESDLPVAQKLYKFSDAEIRILRGTSKKGKGSKGKGIFIVGSQRVAIQTIASRWELEIIDPKQYEEIYGVKSRFTDHKSLLEVN